MQFKDYCEAWTQRVIEYSFNRILTMTTFVGIAGFIVHSFYPQHSVEFDGLVSAYLINMKGQHAITTK